jgi:solute carrier family 30 (zinc transporter), member 9
MFRLFNYKISNFQPFFIQKSSIRYLGRTQTKGEYKSLKKKIPKESLQLHLNESKRLVKLAMSASFVMFGAKTFGTIESGSASMFAESMHSLADVFNESLLLWGLLRSVKKADSDHPYGYLNEKYAWALVSGVGVFFLGGGVTLYHGILGFMNNNAILLDINSSLIALAGCFTLETVTLTFAYLQISRQARDCGKLFFEYLKSGADPSAVQIFMEDSAALFGVIIAATSLILSHYLMLPWIDSVGSITIGILLSCVAVFLIKRNMKGLLNLRMDPKVEKEIILLLQQDPIVKSIHDVKTTSVGSNWARFKGTI